MTTGQRALNTYSTRAPDLKPEWRVIDAQGKILGRLASEIAQILKGKHNPMYAPHLNTGDFVIVINAAKVTVTGDKMNQKRYYRHTGYPGGLRSINLADSLNKAPERVIEHAVKGMLPHTPLGRAMLRRLKVYGGATHPHGAQTKEAAKI